MRIKLYRKFVWCEGLPGFGTVTHYFAVTDENDNLLYLKYFFSLQVEDLEGGREAKEVYAVERRMRCPTWETVLKALPAHFANSEIVSREDVSDSKIQRIWENRRDKTQVLRKSEFVIEENDYLPIYDDTKRGAA